jgi:hypothetical protein
MQRRPGNPETAAVVSLAATKTRVHPSPIKFVVRIALDSEGLANGRRLSLNDLPAGSRLLLDVTHGPYPTSSVVCVVADAVTTGVMVEIHAESVSSVRNWHDLISRAS